MSAGTADHLVRTLAAGDAEAGRTLRHAVGHYASGITVITAQDEFGPVGFTCQSFYSVSLEPPMVSFSVMRSSTTFPRIREVGRFCVNVLSAPQSRLSDQFATRGSDKWSGVEWRLTGAGNPALAGALTWIDCDLRDVHDAGDHHIVTGQAHTLGVAQHTDEPLLYFQGSYRHLRQA
ncbi:flavin reductase family protein [Streptomyces sp. NPDC048275]|uniref:flavin reductase family protein n=1 Tax=Streptomyces sp. NPDC048275 TaxID=3155629 RepID=UPI0033F66D10